MSEQPTEEQLLDVANQTDVVVQTGHPGEPGRHPAHRGGAHDPAQAKEAIDAARALLPLCPEEAVGRSRTPSPDPDALREGDRRGREGGAKRRPREDLDARLVIGIFGGSGFYRFLDDVEEVPVATPYGPPSAPVRIGRIEGTRGGVHAAPRRRAHASPSPDQLPRERLGDEGGGGRPDHRPVRVRLAQAGAQPGHVRALRPVRGPHRTRARAPSTTGRRRPTSPLRIPTARTSARAGASARRRASRCRGRTVVVIQGPRFSTRAESRWFAASGFDVVNMTQYPEAGSPASWSSATRTSRWSPTTTSAWRECRTWSRFPPSGVRRVQREPGAAARAAVPRGAANRPAAGGHLRHRAAQRDCRTH